MNKTNGIDVSTDSPLPPVGQPSFNRQLLSALPAEWNRGGRRGSTVLSGIKRHGSETNGSHRIVKRTCLLLDRVA
jgi:hypothetical protein